MRIKSFNTSFGAQLFKSLGDESRLRILHLLLENEKMCTSDIELILDYTQTKTSRHLIYLKSANIVSLRKVDQYSFYSLTPQVADFLQNIYSYLTDPVLKQDQENYRIMYSNRELRIAKLELQRKI